MINELKENKFFLLLFIVLAPTLPPVNGEGNKVPIIVDSHV